ncbi:DUF1027 domain-containing protein [Aerococcus agrisoli]|uniref:DUF1027 domain-containing protein n=1 Tax=Aerococcus agrisoli TaxID=2487350 RepID=A0A3N4GER9_9LACT|nr:YutD family protein [Aerococcus agrisoli]RPA61252.1 DUF1027 domain-containing protein [Aerococcus agrisoli]
MLSRKRQEELKEKRAELNYPKAEVTRVSPEQLSINGQIFTIQENFNEAINIEAIADRYMDILDTYDYVVGDWSYEQLRLKGFYADDAKIGTLEQKIKHLPDYLIEYASFGAAYFVLAHERTTAEIQARNELFWENQRKENAGGRPRNNKATSNRPAQKKKQANRKPDNKPAANTGDNKTKRNKNPHFSKKKTNNRGKAFNIVEVKDTNTNTNQQTSRPAKKKTTVNRPHSFSIREKGE